MAKNAKWHQGTRYTDEQKAEFVELARIVGIGRAIRELGYPTWTTGVQWMEARGITPNTDKFMQRIRSYHTFYTVEDIMLTLDDAISAAKDLIATAEDADALAKVANALQKIVNTRQLLEGKATAISEKREMSQMDVEIAALIRQQEMENKKKEEREEVE